MNKKTNKPLKEITIYLVRDLIKMNMNEKVLYLEFKNN